MDPLEKHVKGTVVSAMQMYLFHSGSVPQLLELVKEAIDDYVEDMDGPQAAAAAAIVGAEAPRPPLPQCVRAVVAHLVDAGLVEHIVDLTQMHEDEPVVEEGEEVVPEEDDPAVVVDEIDV